MSKSPEFIEARELVIRRLRHALGEKGVKKYAALIDKAAEDILKHWKDQPEARKRELRRSNPSLDELVGIGSRH